MENLTEKVLSSEDYVCCCPADKESFEYKLVHLIKEEIRKHKWMRGTENINLSWEEARDEWMDLYHQEFLCYVMENINSRQVKSRKSKRLSYSLDPKIKMPYHVGLE